MLRGALMTVTLTCEGHHSDRGTVSGVLDLLSPEKPLKGMGREPGIQSRQHGGSDHRDADDESAK